MKHFFAGCLLGLAVATFIPFTSSCSEEQEEIQVSPFLKVDVKALNFEESEGEQRIPVKANGGYDIIVSKGGEWITAVAEKGELRVQVTENDQKEVREAVITLSLKGLKREIKVAQLGWGKAILLSSSSTEVHAPGGTVHVEVTTNIEYSQQIDADWVKPVVATRTAGHPVVSRGFNYEVLPNRGDKRLATITFADNDKESDLKPVTFTIQQKAIDDYATGNVDDVKNDIAVKVQRGYASSFQQGEGIEKSFDGNRNTIYHSAYDNKVTGYFPITLEYTFANGSDMDYFVYYPRPSGPNGLFKEVDIEVKTNANARGVDEWKKVMSYNFAGSSSATRVDFPSSQIGVSSIRFTVKSGTGDGQGFASCAEMEFYKKNPENFDWQELFSDPSCSALKSGISEEEILKCPYSLFKNVAYHLYHHKYPSEFRIADFKAYPHPDRQSATHKTNPYSLLDNPTGIFVENGEQLVVMAALHGAKASLRVQNLDCPGGDGFGGDTYPLAEGANKIKMAHKGLVYVLYHTDDFEQAIPVKLHFISGRVNGYYDSQNPALKDRATELLNKATDKYFDVVGQWAHLTFPTQRFKNHTKDLKHLIDLYDKVVYNEQMLLGLVKYKKEFKNRMYFNVMYHSYMYATAYHTGYNDETLSTLCDDEHLSSSIWGPAHEVGHCNQTRPGLKWLGTTEVTNNIMSEYIQTTVFNEPSRVQVENMNDKTASNRYAKAWNGIIVDKKAHAIHDDVFCKLIPFWQLELYMGKVKGATPLQQADKGGFYPDVYEYIRTHENLPNAGEQQLEFVFIASQCARLNLLDFFEKWGFLREVHAELDDYGKGKIDISNSQIDKVRNRVESLNLPSVNEPIEYISDNNYLYFKEKKAVQKGTASRSGNTVIMNNWKNVIVYEVKDTAQGNRLVAVSEGVNQPSSTASFDIRGGWKSSYKVYAVQYDNQRIEVSF